MCKHVSIEISSFPNWNYGQRSEKTIWALIKNAAPNRNMVKRFSLPFRCSNLHFDRFSSHQRARAHALSISRLSGGVIDFFLFSFIGKITCEIGALYIIDNYVFITHFCDFMDVRRARWLSVMLCLCYCYHFCRWFGSQLRFITFETDLEIQLIELVVRTDIQKKSQKMSIMFEAMSSIVKHGFLIEIDLLAASCSAL